jgi:hypothetical protein
MSTTLSVDPTNATDAASQLGTMALAVMVLQVTGCSSMDCGPGLCTVTGEGASCDCSGTGMTGAYCDRAVASTTPSPSDSPSPSSSRPSSGSTSPGVSPDASRSGTRSRVPSPSPALPKQRVCPGRLGSGGGVAECSGHGVCARSKVDCRESDSDCVAACRWGLSRDHCSFETKRQTPCLGYMSVASYRYGSGADKKGCL